MLKFRANDPGLAGVPAPRPLNAAGLLLVVLIDLAMLAVSVLLGFQAGMVWCVDDAQAALDRPAPARGPAFDLAPLFEFLAIVVGRVAIGTAGGLATGLVAMLALNRLSWIPLIRLVPGLTRR